MSGLSPVRRTHGVAISCVVLFLLGSLTGCQAIVPGASKTVHEAFKATPREFITLAQIRTMPGENKTQHILVVQAYLMDDAMKTLPAEGDFHFFAYFDAKEASGDVKPDFEWKFAPQEAERYRTVQRFGSGYCFLLPVPESEKKATKVTVIGRYTLPSGQKYVSTNSIANVPVTAEFDRTLTKSVAIKNPKEIAPKHPGSTSEDADDNSVELEPVAATNRKTPDSENENADVPAADLEEASLKKP
ncbi:MAG: hypothetical protein U1D30_20025 [Planctomycetota bacterium]